MIIKKFNESVENWSETKIEKLKNSVDDLGSLISDYLFLNHNGLFEDQQQLYNLSDFWFEEIPDNDNWFEVYYTHSNLSKTESINHTFSKNEFEDLLNFMNNPDAYKQSKKYNI